ncbi:MAG: methyltransferase domain-containing protein [Rhodocyclaceae bacterium]
MPFRGRALRAAFPFTIAGEEPGIGAAKPAEWNDPTKHYRPVVARLLNARKPRSVLDAPSGTGWLRDALDFHCAVDGIDLFATQPAGYRSFWHKNLDRGLPETDARYEAMVCCEGIEHFGNPELFFSSARERLVPGGMLIVTTPNTWYPTARLQYLLRGFFPSFPCLAGKIVHGAHMHITPWSFAQLYTYLKLSNFSCIRLHAVAERKPRNLAEWLIGWPALLYCKSRIRRARTHEERDFWQQAGSAQSLFGRRLVVSAIA